MRIVDPHIHHVYSEASRYNFNASLKPATTTPKAKTPSPLYKTELSNYNPIEKAAVAVAIPAPDNVSVSDIRNQRIQNAVHWTFQVGLAVTMSLGGTTAAIGNFGFAYQKIFSNLYKGIKIEVLNPQKANDPKQLEALRKTHFVHAGSYGVILVTSLLNGTLGTSVCQLVQLVGAFPEICKAISNKELAKAVEKTIKISHLTLFFFISSTDQTMKIAVVGLKILEVGMQMYQIHKETKKIELKIGPASYASANLVNRVAKLGYYCMPLLRQ